MKRQFGEAEANLKAGCGRAIGRRGKQVRTRPSAGAKRIRTLGPALAKGTTGCCRREPSERPAESRNQKLRSSRETVMPVGASPRPSRSRRDRDFDSRLRQRRVAAAEEAQLTRPLVSPTEENRCRPGRSIRWCASGTLRKPLSPWPRRQPQPHASTAMPPRRRPSFPRCDQARSRYGPSPAR
jgi:hypothetical protein